MDDDEDNVFSETEVKGYQSLRLQMTALSMLWKLSLFTDSLQGEIFFHTSVTRYRNDQLILNMYVSDDSCIHTYVHTYIHTHMYVTVTLPHTILVCLEKFHRIIEINIQRHFRDYFFLTILYL